MQVLSDLDLKIRRGQKLALVGASGSGKSTLIKLIQRLYDVDSGEVRIQYQLPVYSQSPHTSIEHADNS